MKKITVTVAILLALVLLTAAKGVSAMQSPVTLYVNGNEVSEEIPVKFLNQQLYVPAELIAPHIGLISQWDESAQTGVLKNDDDSIVMKYSADDATLTMNGKQTELKQAGKVYFGEAGPFVPVQWFEQMNSMKVLWDVLTRSVFVFLSGSEPLQPSLPPEKHETENEKIIMLPEEIEKDRSKVVINGFEADENNALILLNGTTDAKGMYLHGEGGNRDRIVIDIPNSQLAESMLDHEGRVHGIHKLEHPVIDQIRYSLFDTESDTIRIVFDLKQKTEYVQLQDESSSNIVLQFRSGSIGSAYTVVIDPGHGGHDPGTEGASGSYERDFTLKLSNKITELLNADPRFHMIQTRSDDEFISLEERAKIANEQNADLFVSIHGNSFDKATSGTETFFYGEESRAFAEMMHEQLLEATGFRDRGTKEVKYRVLALTNMPAALLEIGYLDHAAEESVMLSEPFQDRVAAAAVAGILKYFGLHE